MPQLFGLLTQMQSVTSSQTGVLQSELLSEQLKVHVAPAWQVTDGQVALNTLQVTLQVEPGSQITLSSLQLLVPGVPA